jgi:hypothetical protein
VFLVPAGLVAVFFALAFPRTLQIAGQDEILHYVALGQRLHEHGFSQPDQLIAFSPHLYGFTIWLSHLLCGSGLIPARLPGLAAWCLTAALVWAWLVRRQPAEIAGNAVWALALLVSTPLALQAATIVDIDNTVLVPATLALCLAAARFVEHPGLRPGLLLALLLALALWCRLTTPAILSPVLLLYAWLRCRRSVAGLLACLAAGAALFMLSWWGYCHASGVDFGGPFEYLLGSFVFCTVGADRGIRIGKIALTLLYTLFWLGPAMACLLALLGFGRLRRLCRCRQIETSDLFWLSGAAVLGGYCLVGGTIFGFPKYHCPALPLLLIAAAGSLGVAWRPVGRTAWLAALGVALVGLALQVLLLGDALLLLRLTLRDAVYHGGSARQVLAAGLAGPWLVASVLAAGLLAVLRRLRLLALPCGLLALALGMHAGMACLQLSGGYQTGYNYGDQGDARAVARFLAAELPEGATAIVPGEIVYLLNRPAVTHVSNELWLDSVALDQTLSAERVQATAISLLTNTIDQVESLTAAATAIPGFERVDLGRYVLFLKH